MTLIWIALIAPGALVAYWLFVRPVLRALPQLRFFWAIADGFWEKAWALCGNSLTIAFSYFVQAIGWSLQLLDPVASLLGDPDLRAQITETLQANPAVLGCVLMAISAITIAARLRSFAKKEDE
jgi:hypothetical protein